ncbi:hypothetical protein K432DRAFT_399145 [Lepidopterella palustris CBS 459.81]|uniref:Uncharacterized protein n=1 Tax=Lepidopterella palustris CBS 459.81 TaxID=1314670 RepID=A0A8E2DWQ4_9PEZI|nr:hypothetical protein K432DRAFT_399145 [Lepidopterella palustris CBS 459.81]
MKSTPAPPTFALIILGVHSLGSLALPVAESNDTPFTPFHDCLDSGKTFDKCRQAVAITKRDGGDTDYNPFHDCLNSGKNFNECRKALGLTTRSDATLVERGFDGIIADFGRNWGGQSTCHHDNKGHWLTNTAVRKTATEACGKALKQAVNGGMGKFTKKMGGFYDGNGGPIVKPGVKFLLSTYVQQQTGIDFNLDTLGKDLCTKGIDHLAGDSGCITKKKVGVITEHTAVNGGIFDWTIDGKAPAYRSDRTCSNCILSIAFES